MVTVKDFYGFIDSFAPFCTQAEFDNSGYMVGDRESEVGKVLVSLDLTLGVLKEAEQKGVDLIITHHPVIFNPLENVMSDSLVYRTVKSGISVISAHTNLDIAEDGVNAALIKTLGINEYFLSDNDVFLKIAELDSETTCPEGKYLNISLDTNFRTPWCSSSVKKRKGYTESLSWKMMWSWLRGLRIFLITCFLHRLSVRLLPRQIPGI